MTRFFKPITAEAIGHTLEGVSRLTPRETDVLLLILDGLSNKQAARELDISYRTIDVHRGRVMEKLGARNAVELTRIISVIDYELQQSSRNDIH